MWGWDQRSARNETMYRHRARTWPLWQGEALRTSSHSYPSALQLECRFITAALWNSARFASTQRVVVFNFFSSADIFQSDCSFGLFQRLNGTRPRTSSPPGGEICFFSLGKGAGFTFFFPPWEAMMAVWERSCGAPWGEMSPADKPHFFTLLQRLPSHI